MTTPVRQRCGTTNRKGDLCGSYAHRLILHTDRAEVLCKGHSAYLFWSAALPADIVAVATWDPKRAENGWLWS